MAELGMGSLYSARACYARLSCQITAQATSPRAGVGRPEGHREQSHSCPRLFATALLTRGTAEQTSLLPLGAPAHPGPMQSHRRVLTPATGGAGEPQSSQAPWKWEGFSRVLHRSGQQHRHLLLQGPVLCLLFQRDQTAHSRTRSWQGEAQVLPRGHVCASPWELLGPFQELMVPSCQQSMKKMLRASRPFQRAPQASGSVPEGQAEALD